MSRCLPLFSKCSGAGGWLALISSCLRAELECLALFLNCPEAGECLALCPTVHELEDVYQ
jgi:hypothetical protein